MCFFVFVKGHESHLSRALNKGQGLKSYLAILHHISNKGWQRACALAWEVLEKGSMPKVLAINIPNLLPASIAVEDKYEIDHGHENE